MKTVILTAMMCLALTACGRKGAPQSPGPASAVIYPHIYPAQ